MAFVREGFKPQPVVDEGVKGVGKQVLIGEAEGSPNSIMRRFIIGTDGHTPRHRHDSEHVVFVLSGKGTLFASNDEFKLRQGTSLLVEPNEIHQFRADRGEHLEFLCIIPRK